MKRTPFDINILRYLIAIKRSNVFKSSDLVRDLQIDKKEIFRVIHLMAYRKYLRTSSRGSYYLTSYGREEIQAMIKQHEAEEKDAIWEHLHSKHSAAEKEQNRLCSPQHT